MPRKLPLVLWLAIPLAAFLYFYHLTATGLLGPDEPRYAAIGREMAASGDWITPRLWGEPWFEKPALLYWMTAAGFRLGLGPDLAPRLFVAVLALLFLGFYWWILRREFGAEAAWFSALILGTSIGWLGFSQIGVTDLPMSAAFAAAMLLALPWIARGDARLLPATAALLAVAVLAKGLVPLVLALPLVLRGRIRDLLRPRVVLPFFAVALPWYLLCYWRNGWTFIQVFFVEHHFGRFTSTALQHAQPWWFYIPVLLAGLLPWTPLLLLIRRDRDPRRMFLFAWFLFGFVFFSLAANKLPGYILPLLPAATTLMGLALAEARNVRLSLAACALLLLVFPIAGRILPAAVASGLSRAPIALPNQIWLFSFVALVWFLARDRRRVEATAALAFLAAAGFLYIKAEVLPEVDRQASARGLWTQVQPYTPAVCVDNISRTWRYGLNYYSGSPLPDCAGERQTAVIRQERGQQPRVEPPSSVDPHLSRVVPSPIANDPSPVPVSHAVHSGRLPDLP